jgi:flagellar basal-body rod protein FlgB
MLFGDLPLVSMLKQKMAWHEQRQGVLAQNVANADTPGYKTRDLQDLSFPELMGKNAANGVAMVATNAGHIGPSGAASDASSERRKPFEVTPQGNAVVLEDEVMRVAQNVSDYQMAADLYGRGLGMLKMAIGRRG